MQFSDLLQNDSYIFQSKYFAHKNFIFSSDKKYYLLEELYSVLRSNANYCDNFYLVKLIRTIDHQVIVIVKHDARRCCPHMFINNLAIIGRNYGLRITFVDLNNEQIYDYEVGLYWNTIIPNPSNTILCVYGVEQRFVPVFVPTIFRFYDISDLAKGCFPLVNIDEHDDRFMIRNDADDDRWEDYDQGRNDVKWLDDETIKIIDNQCYCKNCNQWECHTDCLEYDSNLFYERWEKYIEHKAVCEIILQKNNNRMELIDFSIIEPEGYKWKKFLEKK